MKRDKNMLRLNQFHQIKGVTEWNQNLDYRIVKIKREINAVGIKADRKKQLLEKLKKMKREKGYQRMILNNQQKYKKIKFFEKKKVLRKLKRVNKQLEIETDEIKLKEIEVLKQTILADKHYIEVNY